MIKETNLECVIVTESGMFIEVDHDYYEHVFYLRVCKEMNHINVSNLILIEKHAKALVEAINLEQGELYNNIHLIHEINEPVKVMYAEITTKYKLYDESEVE